MTAATAITGQPPLYVNEKECAALCGVSESDWPRVRAQWRKAGFPQPDEITKKYLWPQVKAWVFKRHDFQGSVSTQNDGVENWR